MTGEKRSVWIDKGVGLMEVLGAIFERKGRKERWWNGWRRWREE